jgi:hypothetical protein
MDRSNNVMKILRFDKRPSWGKKFLHGPYYLQYYFSTSYKSRNNKRVNKNNYKINKGIHQIHEYTANIHDLANFESRLLVLNRVKTSKSPYRSKRSRRHTRGIQDLVCTRTRLCADLFIFDNSHLLGKQQNNLTANLSQQNTNLLLYQYVGN